MTIIDSFRAELEIAEPIAARLRAEVIRRAGGPGELSSKLLRDLPIPGSLTMSEAGRLVSAWQQIGQLTVILAGMHPAEEQGRYRVLLNYCDDPPYVLVDIEGRTVLCGGNEGWCQEKRAEYET